MNNIDILKNMIEEAQKENDTILMEYLTKAVEHLTAKNERQEIINQEPTNTKDIIKSITNGNTTITKYVSGKTEIKSDYMGLEVTSSNKDLKFELQVINLDIALDEISVAKNLPQKVPSKLAALIQKTSNIEDLNDIEKYLNDISQIGPMGYSLNNKLKNLISTRKSQINNKKTTLELDNNVDVKLEEIMKNIETLDMLKDDIESKSIKDSEEIYDLAGRYEKRQKDLENFLYTHTDYQNKNEILNTIEELELKSTKLRNFAQQMEDLDYSFSK